MRGAVRWDTDGAKPGSPTSLDVLLCFLKTPGNFQSWLRNKRAVSKGIVGIMNTQGITHRTLGSVLLKMDKLQHQYDTATAWLQERGELVLFRQGNESRAVQVEVARRWPLLREILPVFDGRKPTKANKAQKPSGEVAGGANADANGATKPARKRQASTRAEDGQAESPAPPKKAKPMSSSDKSSTSSNSATQQIPGQEAAPAKVKTTRHDDSAVEFDAAFGESNVLDLEDGLTKFEMERRQELAKCRLDGERKREELRTNCEVLLSRHRLMKAGVPEETIDRMFPLGKLTAEEQ